MAPLTSTWYLRSSNKDLRRSQRCLCILVLDSAVTHLLWLYVFKALPMLVFPAVSHPASFDQLLQTWPFRLACAGFSKARIKLYIVSFLSEQFWTAGCPCKHQETPQMQGLWSISVCGNLSSYKALLAMFHWFLWQLLWCSDSYMTVLCYFPLFLSFMFGPECFS